MILYINEKRGIEVDPEFILDLCNGEDNGDIDVRVGDVLTGEFSITNVNDHNECDLIDFDAPRIRFMDHIDGKLTYLFADVDVSSNAWNCIEN